MPEPEAIRRKIDAAGQDVGHRDRTKLWKVCFNGFRRIYYFFFFTAMRTSAAGHKTPHRKPREKKIHIINACWSVSSKIMELPVVPVLVWQAHDFHPQPAHEAAWEQECFETPLSWWRIFFFLSTSRKINGFQKISRVGKAAPWYLSRSPPFSLPCSLLSSPLVLPAAMCFLLTPSCVCSLCWPYLFCPSPQTKAWQISWFSLAQKFKPG